MNLSVQNLKLQSKRILNGIRFLPNIQLSTFRKVFSLMGKNEQKIFILLFIITIISFVFFANNLFSKFSTRVPSRGGIYREGIIGQPRFINPIYATTITDRSILNLVYAGLYKFDGNGNVVPDIAEGFPEVSSDQKTYTIKLKQANWHNGLPVTANDVIFTIKALQNPEYNSPRKNDWLSTTVEATDERTVVFKLKSVSGPFLNNLTLPIISEVIWSKINPTEAMQSSGNIKAIGNGPYKIKEIKQLSEGSIQSIILESFSNFHDHPPYIETVRINFYENSEELLKALHGQQIDGFGFNQFEQNISLQKSAKDLSIHQIPLPQYQAVFFNTERKLLSDLKIRRALNLATDKQQIINQVYEGRGEIISSPILNQQVQNLPTHTTQNDLQQARDILESAGWYINEQTSIRQKNNISLSFTLVTNDSPINVRTAELIKSQWKNLGVEIILNTIPTRELNDTVIKPRNYDMLLFVQKLGADPDPFIFWHSSQIKAPGFNLANYANQQIDQLISEARASINKESRDQKYWQIHNIMQQDLPAIFLIQPIYSHALNNNIQGYNITTLPDEAARFVNLRYWFTNTKRSIVKKQN